MSHLLRQKLAIIIAAFVALVGWLALGASNGPTMKVSRTSSDSELQSPEGTEDSPDDIELEDTEVDEPEVEDTTVAPAVDDHQGEDLDDEGEDEADDELDVDDDELEAEDELDDHEDVEELDHDEVEVEAHDEVEDSAESDD